MSAVFCCRTARTYSPPLPVIETYQVVRPHSEQSTTYVEDSSIPTAVPGDLHDTKALQDIFSSSSSVRGYQAAARSTCPDDSSESGIIRALSRKTSKSRVGIVTKNVRKRISESRMSKRSSKGSTSRHESLEITKHDLAQPNAFRGMELEDILASRTASQGGYDSDAEKIKTPNDVQADAGSIAISPEYLSKVLHSLEKPPLESSPHSIYVNSSPQGCSRDNAISQDTKSEDLRVETHYEPRQYATRGRTISSPPVLTTPSRPVASTTVQFGNQESPKDLLRRLSETLCRIPIGTLPNSLQEQESLNLSFSAPRRASSLERRNTGTNPLLDQVPNSSVSTKQISDSQQEQQLPDKRLSIVPDPDDSVLGPISSYWRQQVTQEEDHNTTARDENVGFSAMDQRPSQRLDIQSESDPSSIHLFNMRISQRLASASLNPMSSPSESAEASNHSHNITNASSLNRLSSMSNPNPGLPTHFLGPSAQISDVVHQDISPRRPQVRDDVSSIYSLQKDSLPESPNDHSGSRVAHKPIETYFRRQPGTNTGFDDSKRYESMGNLSNEDEGSWIKRDALGGSTKSLHTLAADSSASQVNQRHESDTVLKSSRFVEEIAIESLQSVQEQPSTSVCDNPTEFALRLTERLKMQNNNHPRDRANSHTTRSTSDGWLSGGRRVGYGYDIVESTDQDGRSEEDMTMDMAMPKEETAKNFWERTLKVVREERRLGGSRKSFSTSFRSLGRNGSQYLRPTHAHDQISKSELLSIELDIENNLNQAAQQSPNGEMFELLHARGRSRCSMSSGISPSFSLPKRSVDRLRRYTTLPFNPRARGDTSSWTRFPSHTRHERTGNAGISDHVNTRDFSPMTPIGLVAPCRSTPSSSRYGTGSHKWSRRTINAGRSVTLTKYSAKRILKNWTWLYRSHSSDLRRFRAGHRSSISKGGSVEYPELELIPGFFGPTRELHGGTDGAGNWRLCGRVPMEELGDVEKESLKMKKMSEAWKNKQDRKRLEETFLAGDMSLDGAVPDPRHAKVEGGEQTGLSATTLSKMYQQYCLGEADCEADISALKPLTNDSSPSYFTASSSNVQNDAGKKTAACGATESEKQDDSYIDMSVSSEVGSGRSKGLKSSSMSGVLSTESKLRQSESTNDDGFRARVKEEERKSKANLLEMVGRIGTGIWTLDGPDSSEVKPEAQLV